MAMRSMKKHSDVIQRKKSIAFFAHWCCQKTFLKPWTWLIQKIVTIFIHVKRGCGLKWHAPLERDSMQHHQRVSRALKCNAMSIEFAVILIRQPSIFSLLIRTNAMSEINSHWNLSITISHFAIFTDIIRARAEQLPRFETYAPMVYFSIRSQCNALLRTTSPRAR